MLKLKIDTESSLVTFEVSSNGVLTVEVDDEWSPHYAVGVLSASNAQVLLAWLEEHIGPDGTLFDSESKGTRYESC